MGSHSLYDEDILLWSEQQAGALRRLGETRRYSNELDIDNVAEEIESVGRSELAAVESNLRLVLAHLLKLVLEPDSDAARHWHGEIVIFHAEARRRYSPSMRQRIDLKAIWRPVRKQALIAHRDSLEQQRVAALPEDCPLSLDDLLDEEIDSFALLERLRQAAQPNKG